MTWPVRFRLTLTWLATAAVLTAVGGGLFWSDVHSGLQNNRDEHLRSRTVRLVAKVGRDGADAVHAHTPADTDALIELVDPAGRLTVASPGLPDAPLLTAGQLAAARRDGVYLTVGHGPDYRLYAAPAPAEDGTWVVVTATPLAEQNSLATTVTGALAVAAAAVLVIGGIGAWFLAGASLRPVERLRREVAAVSDADPSGCVHVPATGDELAALAVTMNDLLGRIAAGLARQRQFVADASHEVRTPLANLRTTFELASAPQRSRAELVEAVRFGERETVRLARLLDDLLVLAAADDHAPLDLLPQVPLRPLLRAAAAAAEPVATAAAVDILVEAPAELAVPGHPGRLRQVLDNLVSNAVKHSPAGSRVTLSARADGDLARIEVADEGPGFPPGFAEHAFERFRPGSAGGHGLGLAVVRAIAREHGGDVVAANRDTGGAVVTVRVPRSAP